MSAESLAIFQGCLYDGEPGLHAAAVQHVDCSRSLEYLSLEYALALENGDHVLAQQLAEELVPVRQAHAVIARGDGDDSGMD